MTPFDDFQYIVNHIMLGKEMSIEDVILLIGSMTAITAFLLWCCFPIPHKNVGIHRQPFSCKTVPNSMDSQLQHSNRGYSKNTLILQNGSYSFKNGSCT